MKQITGMGVFTLVVFCVLLEREASSSIAGTDKIELFMINVENVIGSKVRDSKLMIFFSYSEINSENETATATPTLSTTEPIANTTEGNYQSKYHF